MNNSIIKFSFGTLKVEKDIAIGVINEGVTLDLEKFKQISSTLTAHFKNKPYGYISHRVNSYAIDPTVYMYVASKDILRAIAIVTEVKIMKTNAIIEKQFVAQPLEVFHSISDAKKWIKKHILL
ncbi:hypothetical protein [Dokdonia sp. Hel_I_53]|uniref:DUF7793 family protein n=1 Tax=Dokdonia sp. Hel_I_53 TaxID=1566287 RepID=UPI00119A4A13|nr:hypothetical protein [Dokdonia sp. Hel_I_53]TVZ51462.1 hypothetical protein OD90_0605 [Dokdonia sp. Hel_I_53]